MAERNDDEVLLRRYFASELTKARTQLPPVPALTKHPEAARAAQPARPVAGSSWRWFLLPLAASLLFLFPFGSLSLPGPESLAAHSSRVLGSEEAKQAALRVYSFFDYGLESGKTYRQRSTQ